MADAPFCKRSTDQVIAQPPIKRLPAIPPPNDLQSAINAINMLINYVYQLSGQIGPTGPQGDRGSPGQPGRPPNQNVGRWIETNRATEKVKIYNPDDHDQWVEVLRTNSLTMRDSVTGELWQYSRGGDQAG